MPYHIIEYHLPCACGRTTTVTEGAAGAAIACACGRTINVPSLDELRRLAPVADIPAAPFEPTVNLPITHQPAFPDRCIVCGVKGPQATIGFSAVKNEAQGPRWRLPFGRRYTVNIPSCRRCAARLRRRRLLITVVGAAYAVVSLSYAVYFFGWYHGPFKKWLTVGVGLACLIPFFLLMILFRPPVELTASDTTVQYRFRDVDYAKEFAAMNRIPW